MLAPASGVSSDLWHPLASRSITHLSLLSRGFLPVHLCVQISPFNRDTGRLESDFTLITSYNQVHQH